jgi:hypothetical protein
MGFASVTTLPILNKPETPPTPANVTPKKPFLGPALRSHFAAKLEARRLVRYCPENAPVLKGRGAPQT